MDGRESIKKNAVRNYIDYRVKDLKSHGIYLKEETLEKLAEKYASKNWNMREIEKAIDKEIDQLIENYKMMQQLREEYRDKAEANKDIGDLPLEYSEIKLDKETERLMKIDDAKTPDELKEVIDDASSKKPTLEDISYTDEQILDAEKEIYRMHQENVIEQNEYQRDSSSISKKKMDYLEDIGEITEKEKDTINDILETSSSTKEVVEKINNNFDEEKAKEIYEIVNKDTPIENTNIKNTTPSDFENPLEKDKEDALDDMFNDTPKEEQENSIEAEKPKQFIKYNDTEGSAGVLSLVSLLIIAVMIIVGFFLMTMLIK